jgi:hypothetical protein
LSQIRFVDLAELERNQFVERKEMGEMGKSARGKSDVTVSGAAMGPLKTLKGNTGKSSFLRKKSEPLDTALLLRGVEPDGTVPSQAEASQWHLQYTDPMQIKGPGAQTRSTGSYSNKNGKVKK